jgi:hypothetical protein
VTGFAHRVLPYLSEREYVATLVPFLAEGHAAGDRLLVVATPARFQLLRAELPSAAGVEFVDSNNWYRSPGHATACAAKHFRLTGDSGLRVIGEPPWQQSAPDELAEWSCYEAACNLAFANVPIQVVCPYRISETPAGVLAEALRTHAEMTDVLGTRACAGYVAPREFVPDFEPELPQPPPASKATVVRNGTFEDVARLATRRALELGVVGRSARNFGLAAHEAAAQFFPDRPVEAQMKVWTARRELVGELLCRGPRQPRITGYLQPHPTDGTGDRLWLTRRLCRVVRLASTPYGMRVRLHLPAL